MTARRQLDRLYLWVDHACLKSPCRADSILAAAQPQEMGVQLTVGLLTITARYAPELPARAEFFDRAWRWLSVAEPDRASRLLRGLQ